MVYLLYMLFGISFLGNMCLRVWMCVCVFVAEGLRRSFATPDPFVLTNKMFKPSKLFCLLPFEKCIVLTGYNKRWNTQCVGRKVKVV